MITTETTNLDWTSYCEDYVSVLFGAVMSQTISEDHKLMVAYDMTLVM